MIAGRKLYECKVFRNSGLRSQLASRAAKAEAGFRITIMRLRKGGVYLSEHPRKGEMSEKMWGEPMAKEDWGAWGGWTRKVGLYEWMKRWYWEIEVLPVVKQQREIKWEKRQITCTKALQSIPVKGESGFWIISWMKFLLELSDKTLLCIPWKAELLNLKVSKICEG